MIVWPGSLNEKATITNPKDPKAWRAYATGLEQKNKLSDATSALSQYIALKPKDASAVEELAGLYHRWYDNCRVIPLGDDPIEPVHQTRLWLNDATGQVLRNGLTLLGVGAPERM